MISYIRGEILFCQEGAVVIDTGGIGVEVNVTAPTLAMLENRSGQIELYTYLNVKEDAMTLFGFTSRRDLKLFKMLITVNGIGPKSALSILSNMSAADLIAAILSEDDKTIAKTPGVGAKSAGRIVIDLKDRLSYEDMLTGGENSVKSAAISAENPPDSTQKGGTKVKKVATVRETESKAADDQAKNEAIQALSALGYSVSEAMRAVRSIDMNETMTTEEILKESLKYL